MESSWTGSARFQRAPSLTAKDVIDLPPPLLRELSDSFQFFDRNGDGKISQDELAAVMRSLGQPVSDSEIQSLIEDVDANGDGFIDLYEFIDLNTRPTSPPTSSSDSDSESSGVDDEILASAFGVFDVDKNGYISADELQRVLVAFGDSGVTVEECRLMIESVDEDGDEMVDFREFVSMMSRNLVY
jgi:calcium-binding protein CML